MLYLCESRASKARLATQQHLRPVSGAQDHQKCALGPKVWPYFAWSRCDQHFNNCRLVLRIATPPRPTQFWVSQWCRDGVAMRPRSLFQVSQWYRDGVAMRLRSLFQVSQWCRIATNVLDCAYHVPHTCPLRIFGSNLAIGCKIKGQDDSIG